MAPDDFQRAWQMQSSQTRVTIHADSLPQLVERSRHAFQSMIFWRDCREVGTALFMIPFWILGGLVLSLPWTWYLAILANLWVAGFMLVDRKRHPRSPDTPGQPLLESVKASVTEVEHQIWLLRNVMWWYLLPFTIAILAFFAQVCWSLGAAMGGWQGILSQAVFFAMLSGFVLVTYAWIYRLNQQAVRTQLEPQRQELLSLIAQLSGESTTEVSGDFSHLLKAETLVCSPRRMLFAGLCAVLILIVGGPSILYLAFKLNQAFDGPRLNLPLAYDGDASKRSPFSAVQWKQSQPQVKVGDEWFDLVSLDGVPVTDIVTFSQGMYRGDWQKRFEEDLVEVLKGLGHPPKDTVQLVVTPPDSEETRTLENVPMTEANRSAIKDAAIKRERLERDQPTRSSSHTEDADNPFTKLVIAQRTEKNLVGLAAMVMVDGKVISSASDGERKKGSGVWLQDGDRWHLAGITKSITATMLARLIEQGQLDWSETVGERFRGEKIHDDWKPVTLRQLMTDTAGAPNLFSPEVNRLHPPLGPRSAEMRRVAVLGVLAERPIYPPGQKSAYSSVGYTIAGAMAEKATGANWEELVQRLVYDPLNLTNSGLGPPKSSDEKLEQPRGHVNVNGVKYSANDRTDNTFIMGPAGIAHMSLRDLCTFATAHVRGELGQGDLLMADTYRQLHALELNRYACGWLIRRFDAEIPHTVYWHNGTNTLWYALVAFIPEKKMVVAVTSNDGGSDKAESAAWEIVKDAVNQAPR